MENEKALVEEVLVCVAGAWGCCVACAGGGSAERYNCLRSPLVLMSSLTGLTSMLPTLAGAICAAIWMASFRSLASIK